MKTKKFRCYLPSDEIWRRRASMHTQTHGFESIIDRKSGDLENKSFGLNHLQDKEETTDAVVTIQC